MQPDTYGTVKLSEIKKAIKRIESHYDCAPSRVGDIDVTFEFLVGSFFPEIMENIHKAMNEQYTKGYMAGIAEGKNDSQIDK